MRRIARSFLAPAGLLVAACGVTGAGYVNFESSHVHPIALTANGMKLLAVNTPDAVLEVFAIDAGGNPVPEAAIPVGLEPVTVVARGSTEAWVVNRVSGSVSVVDLSLGTTVRTIRVGREPSDVVFAQGKAFVAVSGEDAVKVYDLANLTAPPVVVNLSASRIRALATSPDGNSVYAVPQDSGNQTTVVNGNVIEENSARLNATRLASLGLNTMTCGTAPPPYPPLPAGIVRNPLLSDPPDRIPKVGLIVKWNEAEGKWQDDAGQDWTACLPFRLPDHDLFVIDAANPSSPVVTVDHLGTTLFEVSVNPASGKIYVPNTDARNFVRFEPQLKGHAVDNRLSIVSPAPGFGVSVVDLNAHIDRASNPATNLPERLASVSQPGMMVWKSDGSLGYLTAIGSAKLFVVDGACTSGNCIFGPSRAMPRAVDVGEGPSGVALLESKNRLYVLNRIANSISVVDAPTLATLSEVPLHDPAPGLREGRGYFYNAVLGSGHGDAACTSCHISGDKDGIAWDLGEPPRNLVPYTALYDNVRFVTPVQNDPAPCFPGGGCSAHTGFDPQKGPMNTITMRSMLEPLHWRGDRPTMNDFNATFVDLLGALDIGPINGQPAALPADDMAALRQFTLDMRLPPNPNRNVNDTLPASAPIPGTAFTGNPSNGQVIFDNFLTVGSHPCVACHSLPFGTAGGKLDGVTPAEPTTLPDAAALVNGDQVDSMHSDLRIPQLRNLWDKQGFAFGPAAGPYPEAKSGFGFSHDGSFPNLLTFLSRSFFTTMSATNAKDLAAFLLHFSTGIKPSVGRNLTCPAGTPPQAGCDESLLSTLLSLGDLANAARHCELTATALAGGRLRSYRWSGGVWQPDMAADPPLTTTALRTGAEGPISFLCAPVDSGLRLGGDRDEDNALNGDDCAPTDPLIGAHPVEVAGLAASGVAPTQISWSSQSNVTGPLTVYDLVGGFLSDFQAAGLPAAGCVASNLAGTSFVDSRANPNAGDGYYYLVRAESPCGAGSFGDGRAALDSISCPSP